MPTEGTGHSGPRLTLLEVAYCVVVGVVVGAGAEMLWRVHVLGATGRIETQPGPIGPLLGAGLAGTLSLITRAFQSRRNR
jgi:hypothetical protein